MKICMLFVAMLASTSLASAQTPSKIRKTKDRVPNRYVVVVRESSDPEAIGLEAATLFRGRLKHVYRGALRGFAIRIPEAIAARLADDPRISLVAEDGLVRASATQAGAPWGLDRIDQRTLPLNQQYGYNAAGTGVDAYIIDTGIRTTHQEFGGRAFIEADFVDDDLDGDPADVGNDDSAPSRPDGADCNGHGTHVAATVGGQTYGAAKSVTLRALRVLDCEGTGSWSDVIAAIDYVTSNATRPAVVNMSLAGGAMAAADDAVRRSIAAGVTYVLAAGNDGVDVSTISPARTAEAITVGATDDSDARAAFSNFGSGIDLFAPGVGIPSAYFTSDSAFLSMSGTSMASPHVAGLVALYLERHPTATPSQVRAALVNGATLNRIGDAGTGSPNRLAYSGFVAPPLTPPAVTVVAPNGGETLFVNTPVVVQWTASDPDGLARFDVEASSDGVNFFAVAGCTGLDGGRRSCTWAAPGPATTNGRIRVTARDSLGANAFDASDARFTIASQPPASLSAPWVADDVGAVGRAGSTTWSASAFATNAGGVDVWAASDAFHFVHRQWTGDGDLVARIEQLAKPADAAFAMAGIMFRESLAASAPHASMVITTDGKAKFRRRRTTGGTTLSDGPSVGTTSIPRWVKLSRRGDVFTAAISADGLAWTRVHVAVTVDLPATVEVGFLALRNGGAGAATARVTNVSLSASSTLPAGWSSTDVGAVGAPGSASHANSTFTVNAAGKDIWAAADAFHFVRRSWTGDGDIVARVAQLTKPTGATFALAALTFRESTAAGARHATLLIATDAKVKFRRRTAAGGTTLSDGPSAGTTSVPRWLKLSRRANVFSAFISSDGVTWTPVHTPQSIVLPATVSVGLAVARTGGSALTTATLTNVKVGASLP
jgi:subtilisin family serine protease